MRRRVFLGCLAASANLLAGGRAFSQGRAEQGIDERRVAAAGIRKISGRHITIYTDLPAGEVDELPQVFDAALPIWCAYCSIDPKKVADWSVRGYVMLKREPFQATGLYDLDLPDFPNGYSRGRELWFYDQPSAYYRRHLLLHEGTHCFMADWLGGTGPPWYMEGTAELLGTHRWEAGKLTMGVMPRSRDEVPYWGRIKIVRDGVAAGKPLSLIEIMQYDQRAHLQNEPYGWCWAAAAFLDAHPLTSAEFRKLQSEVHDHTIAFSKRFYEKLRPQWPAINEDWHLFLANCDYGYDFARSAVVHRESVDLPAAGATVDVAADRGWQSSGYRLKAGQTYKLTASGRFEIGKTDKPWPCEPGGITIRYHGGRPLGMLLAAVKADDEAVPATSLAKPQPIGLTATINPSIDGILYFCVNEASSGLAGNRGSLKAVITAEAANK